MLQRSVALAYTDTLTGVYNRRYMNAHLDRKIMEIAETVKPVSVLMFDIDKFKSINDSYGHKGGDEVLIELAKRVSRRSEERRVGEEGVSTCRSRGGADN